MSWTKTETVTQSPDAQGDKVIAESWAINDRDGNAVLTVAKDGTGVKSMTFAGSINGSPKVYRALLTQTGTDAPVATVLENTLGGTVVWAYADGGRYTAALIGAFPAAKTCLPMVNATATMDGTDSVKTTSFMRTGDDELLLETARLDPVAGSLTFTNSVLSGAYVEILVYP